MSKSYRPQEKTPDIRYLPDTAKQINDTFRNVDYKQNLSRAFRDRIARVKGGRR